MKVRRKSEIAEAVANAIIEAIPVAKYLEQPVKEVLLETITEILAAHYEPVPEPPARDAMHSEDEVGCFHYFVDHRVCKYCGEPAAPSVSEEQPARERSVGRIDPQRIAQTNHNIKEQLKTAAPHRATIAMIPCPRQSHAEDNRKAITVDSVYHTEWTAGVPDIWCGTEAEAKAKMESLSKGGTR